ncbi:MAG TPA: AI-2E family transporter [Planctomycetaceae bacterium]|nr:AI-2E family transporter [Planctomycetaceae bacterium]
MPRLNPVAKPSWMLTLASISVVVAALYLAKAVLIPLTVAVLLSFLLSSVCDWLERRGLPRTPAVLMTVALGFTVLGGVAWTSAVQITHLAPKLPQYQNNLRAKLNAVNEYAVAALSTVTRTTQEMDQDLSTSEQAATPRGTNALPFSVRVVSSPASPLQVFGGVFGTVLEMLATTGIVFVLVVYFLVRRDDLRDRCLHLFGKGHVTLTTQTLEDAGARVRSYLSMLLVINVSYGVSVGIGLSLIGVPNAVLWGILATVLRFIPYIGPWIAAAMPVGLSMAISPGWVTPLLTVGLFVVLELFSNNVLEPWLYGKSTGVSAAAVLVAAVFWMWLWGPVGLLLATPLTVCLLVVGKSVPQLSFLDILLGSEPVFEPHARVYQRLLAGDQEEAAEVLEECLESQSLVEVYDTVLIPALALAETHWQLGELNDRKHDFITQSLKELIQIRGERLREAPADEEADAAPMADGDSHAVDLPETPGLGILCLPARTEADEIASLILAQILQATHCVVQSVPVTSQASEMADLVEQHEADVVCISATPPAAVMHARYLCKQLRGRFPELTLVVGLWDAQGDLNKARERIGCGATVVATLADAQEHMRRLIPRPCPPTGQRSPLECEQLVAAGSV